MTPPLQSDGRPWWERATAFWPMGIAAVSIIAFGARADTRITELEGQGHRFEALSSERTDRMARVETKIDAQAQVLARIESRLEHLERQSSAPHGG